MEGLLELDNHHFATIVAKIEKESNYQWMLNGGRNFDEQDIYFIFEFFP